MAKVVKEDELTESQKQFCREYIYDWNGSRSYKVAYPGVTDETARVNASKLLTKANINEYWKNLADDDERYTGVSRRMILLEHKKIIQTNLGDIHDTWITRKEFENLPMDIKSCISQIETQTRMETNPIEGGPPIQIDYVKIKLYDKQKSLDSLSKMMGYEAPKKIEQVSTVKSYEIVPASGKRASSK